MSSQEITAVKSINLCDLGCPHLLIAVIKTIEQLAVGEIIEIKATDLNAPSSIGSWSRQSNNPLRDMYEENGCFVFLLQRGEENPTTFVNQQNSETLGKEGS